MVTKIVPKVDQVSFSGRRAVAQGQEFTYVTGPYVISSIRQGLVLAEVACGVVWRRDVLGQTVTQLHVAADLKVMGAGLFLKAPFGLVLGAVRVCIYRLIGTLRIFLARRSEKLNALAAEVEWYVSFISLWLKIKKSSTQVVILTGEGETFCARGDFAAWSVLPQEDFGRRRSPMRICALPERR